MMPATALPVDPRNPGQVLACCGVLELLQRLAGPVRSWFQLADPPCFYLEAGEGTVRSAVEKLKSCPVACGDDDTLTLLEPLSLRLDWWTERSAGAIVPKTWAGGVRPRSFFPAYQQALQPETHKPSEWWDALVSLDSASPGLDPREYTHTLDTGFSSYDLKIRSSTYVYVQVLALIGLQRFRPTPEARHTFSYALWQDPLLPAVAALAFAGQSPLGRGVGFAFRLRARDQENRYKAFSFATKKGGQP